MEHTHHLIISRAILLFNNFKINTKLQCDVESHMNVKLTYDMYGRLVASRASKPSGSNVGLDQYTNASRETECSSVTKTGHNDNILDIGVIKKEKPDSFIPQPILEKYVAKNVQPEDIFDRLFYSADSKTLLITLFDTDVWNTSSLTLEVVQSLTKCNGENLTPPEAPFILSEEAVMRCLDQTKYLNGEFIDACLITICGIMSATYCILPSQFLTVATLSSIGEWLPPSVSSGQCPGLLFAAHHPGHWCLVAINCQEGVVLYLDSCPTASNSTSKRRHLAIVDGLLSYLKCPSSDWKFMFNREAAQYFDIDALPQQCTSTDCGVMVCLFAWMSICRFREEDLWCNKLDIPDSNESFQLVRLFLAYITLYFSDYYGVHDCAVRSDTVKWMSVKLFPFATKKIRIDDRLLNSTTISNKDRLKYISLHFPDTLELFEYLKQSAEENIELPKVFSCDDTDFKNFIHLVRNSDWVEWREMLLFTCFNKDDVTSLNKILQSNKWKISYELQELSVWPWSEAQIISILHD